MLIQPLENANESAPAQSPPGPITGFQVESARLVAEQHIPVNCRQGFDFQGFLIWKRPGL